MHELERMTLLQRKRDLVTSIKAIADSQKLLANTESEYYRAHTNLLNTYHLMLRIINDVLDQEG